MFYASCIYSLAPSNVKPLFADTSSGCGQPVAVMPHSTPAPMHRIDLSSEVTPGNQEPLIEANLPIENCSMASNGQRAVRKVVEGMPHWLRKSHLATSARFRFIEKG
jgi:hypothetical protein